MVMKCTDSTFPSVSGLSVSIQAYKKWEKEVPKDKLFLYWEKNIDTAAYSSCWNIYADKK